VLCLSSAESSLYALGCRRLEDSPGGRVVCQPRLLREEGRGGLEPASRECRQSQEIRHAKARECRQRRVCTTSDTAEATMRLMQTDAVWHRGQTLAAGQGAEFNVWSGVYRQASAWLALFRAFADGRT